MDGYVDNGMQFCGKLSKGPTLQDCIVRGEELFDKYDVSEAAGMLRTDGDGMDMFKIMISALACANVLPTGIVGKALVVSLIEVASIIYMSGYNRGKIAALVGTAVVMEEDDAKESE